MYLLIYLRQEQNTLIFFRAKKQSEVVFLDNVLDNNAVYFNLYYVDSYCSVTTGGEAANVNYPCLL